MLVILDQSRTVWVSGGWKAQLEFFQTLVKNSRLGPDTHNFMLASFSEDTSFHVSSFDRSFDKEELVALADPSNPELMPAVNGTGLFVR